LNQNLPGHFAADVPSTNPYYKGRGNMRLLFRYDDQMKEITLVGLADYHGQNNEKLWNDIQENEKNDFLKTEVKDIKGKTTYWGVRKVHVA
jgi:hypothetical protein